MTKTVLMLAAGLMMAVVLTSGKKNDKVMVKEKGVYVVNTTELAKDVMGYEGTTPLKVYIRKNKVEKVEFLPNQETPKYWAAAKKHFMNVWDGKTVKEARAMQVDGRTGATFTSNAIKENIKRALEYYEKNK